MRDRLIELIVDAENEIYHEKPYCTDTERIAKVADLLLSEGVIVPPCKVGQTVYFIRDGLIIERQIRMYFLSDVGLSLSDNRGVCWGVSDIKLTREEAYKALAKRREG